MKAPMALTFVRLIIIPFFVVFFYIPGDWARWLTVALFALAAFTDWLDGFLARRLHQTSRFGAFLDPVADKLVVVIALVLLVAKPYLPLIAVPAAIIVGRELVISALREWMAELGKRASVAVAWLGKVKTVVQMLALLFLLACTKGSPEWIFYVGYILLYIAAVLTLWSMFLYFKAAWPDFDFMA